MIAITAPSLTGLANLLDLIGDAKRIRVAGRPGSLAEQGFRSAWAQLVTGVDGARIARRETAAAVAAVRLGAWDVGTLLRAGLGAGDVLTVLRRAVADVAEPLSDAQRAWLDDGLGELVAERPAVGEVPPFVEALCEQPRAGVNPPGRRRIMTEPRESHADHCWVVAVGGALLAESFGADPGETFLVGLAHHLHNATLPDPGFPGEALLDEHLPTVIARSREESLRQLALPLRDDMVQSLLAARDAETATGRAFHAANVLDRVLQAHHYAREAAFTLGADLGLVRDGPLRAFHEAVLDAAGLG